MGDSHKRLVLNNEQKLWLLALVDQTTFRGSDAEKVAATRRALKVKAPSHPKK